MLRDAARATVATTLEAVRALPDAGEAEPVQIVTTSLPGARRNAAYSATLEVSGGRGALRWRIDRGSLPPGITLDATRGIIAGTPLTNGTWLFTAVVTDSRTTDRRTFAISVRR